MRFNCVFVQFRLAHALLLSLALGCAMTPERLPDLDRRFYEVMESPEDQSAFLQLKDDQRQGFLESRGLWARWYELTLEQRKQAQQGEIEVGFPEFAVFMAWGPPADTVTRERGGRTATVHTYIRCSSGPKRGDYVRSNLDCVGTSDETQVAIDGGVIVEIKFAV